MQDNERLFEMFSLSVQRNSHGRPYVDLRLLASILYRSIPNGLGPTP